MLLGACAGTTTRRESSQPWALEADRFHSDTRAYKHEGSLQCSNDGKTPSPKERSRALRADWLGVLLIVEALQEMAVVSMRMRAKHSGRLDRRLSRAREVCFVRRKYANDYAGL